MDTPENILKDFKHKLGRPILLTAAEKADRNIRGLAIRPPRFTEEERRQLRKKKR
jgi:hypothetical protein